MSRKPKPTETPVAAEEVADSDVEDVTDEIMTEVERSTSPDLAVLVNPAAAIIHEKLSDFIAQSSKETCSLCGEIFEGSSTAHFLAKHYPS